MKRPAWPRWSARTWLHAAVGGFVALVLPGLSWLDGNGTFAWTMFSKSSSFRVGVLLTSRDGARVPAPPAVLARFASPWMAYYLERAGDWLYYPVGITFRSSLPMVAALGCRLDGVTLVVVTLQERRDLDAPIQVTEARAACPPP